MTDQVLRARRYVTFDDLWRFLCLPDEAVITAVTVDPSTRTLRIETMGDGDPLTDGMEAPMKLWVSEHMRIVQELAVSDPVEVSTCPYQCDATYQCIYCTASSDEEPESWEDKQPDGSIVIRYVLDHDDDCLRERAKRLVEQ